MERRMFYIRPFLNCRISSFFFKSHKRFIMVLDTNTKIFFCKNLNYINKNVIYLRFEGFKIKKIILNEFLNLLYNFIKGMNQGFYIKFKIVGLGFKVRRVFLENKQRYLKINLGYSHNIFYKIPKIVNVFVKKKILFLQAFDFNILMSLTKRLQTLRMSNPYKEKGILLYDKIIKLKSGKQQQK